MTTTTTPKCRGLSFADALVPRVLDGSKTVTRRPIKRLLGIGPVRSVRQSDRGSWLALDDHGVTHTLDAPALIARNPYGRPGVDTLYGREACQIESNAGEGIAGYLPPHDDGRPVRRWMDPDEGECWEQAHYRATDPRPTLGSEDGLPWRPPHLMPRWASRMPLAIVSVRPEMLSWVTAEEVIAEGLSTTLREHDAVVDVRERFLSGWDALYAGKPEYQSASDPAVWRIEFKLLEAAP